MYAHKYRFKIRSIASPTLNREAHVRLYTIQLVLRVYVGAFYSTAKGNSTPFLSIGPTPRHGLYNVQNYTIGLLQLSLPVPIRSSLTLLGFFDCKRYARVSRRTINFSSFRRQIFCSGHAFSFGKRRAPNRDARAARISILDTGYVESHKRGARLNY